MVYFGKKRAKITWVEISGDLRKNEEKNNKIVPSQILTAEQSFPVNIQPVVSLALIKIENKTRDPSLFKIHLFLHFSSGLMPVTGEASACRGAWM